MKQIYKLLMTAVPVLPAAGLNGKISTSKRLLLMIVIMISSIGVMYSQVTTSGINGKIYGSNYITLPGATVILVHTPTGTQYSTITDDKGIFRIPNMQSGGPYEMKISYVGYKTLQKSDITLALGQTLTFNESLTEAAVGLTEVEVIEKRDALIDGNRTGSSTNVNSNQITTLPSINRSITDYTKLSPQANGNSFAGRDGRMNNITIDGANFNNNFGLSSKALPGGDAQPISLDAIEQISINIAPFDIRQSNFTGANVNAVTKSGTNKWSGTAYTYIRGKNFYGKKIEDKEIELTDQNNLNYGLSVGGPIIKNKLFVFANFERETSDFPGILWNPSDPDNGVNADPDNYISRTTVADLSTMKEYLMTTYGYDAGTYQDFGNFQTKNYKILGKIDWNINKNHRFSIRYNYVKSTNDQQVNATSSPGTRSAFGRIGEMSMSFNNANYGFLNTVGSLSAELNSTWSKSANKFLFTYTQIRDTRSSESDIFPFVDIYKDGNPYMSFGYELFSLDNDVKNNVLTFTDNFNYYLGQHTLTVGASFDKLFFGNSYKRYGTSYYRFASPEDFYNGAAPTTFGITYPYAQAGDGYAELNFGYASVYGQDEWQVLDNLKITGGIRLELPIYFNELLPNEAITELTFKDLDGNDLILDAGLWPDPKMTVSPRLSFNWDAKNDKSLQVRGGTGIFTGRLPFVWFTNQPTNSGTLQNTVEITNADDLAGLTFNADPFYHLTNTDLFPSAPTKAPGSIAVVDKNFKMPQVWRTDLALDVKLPWNLIGTFEAIYSKAINDVIQYNANQAIADSMFFGADDRERFMNRKINSTVSNAMVLTNTKEGYSYSLTAQLAREFENGFYGFLAYTYSATKDLTSNPGSAAASAWASNPTYTNQNAPTLSYSQFSVPHRVVGCVSYGIEYAKHLKTTVSLFYQGSSQGRLDYIYSNDMNGDGNSADLMYIPKDESEIIFADITNGDGEVIATAAEQGAAFWQYVDQDKYLSDHKGEYAERYGVVMPWVGRFDVKILQDVFTKIGKTKHTLQFSLDFLNIGNLINSDWGIYRKQTLGNYDITLLKYKSSNSEGVPTYQLNYTKTDSDGKPVFPTSTYSPVLGTTSTWGMQIGIRYIF
ncbi:MAG TPA: TonB-dependent receptor [Bacteroidales bacterium]|nr:TonB-dependent receptor [Bacteroidales bacterium]HOX76408.1 TonB-dependent receptor [Bacteroidales bacterium]HPM93606.1 TonB-dependent receptor [Bacteroidales bacterium]